MSTRNFKYFQNQIQRFSISFQGFQGPEQNIQGYLVIHQEFRAFEVSRGHSDVVLLGRMIKLGQTPVYETKL